MFPRSLAIAASIVSIALATPAFAAWNPGGNQIGVGQTTYPVFDAKVWDLPNGDLMVMAIGTGGSTNGFQVQRVTREGLVASGWPAIGVSLNFATKGCPVRSQGFFLDGGSHLWRAWNYSGVHLEQIDGSGVHSPSGSPGYYLYSSDFPTSSIAPGPGGDVFIGLGDSYIRRVTSTGANVANHALPTASFFNESVLLADGSDGCYAFLRFGSTGGAVLQRFDSNLNIASGWPASGRSLSSIPTTSNHQNYYSALIPSGPDHIFAAWWDGLNLGPGAFRIQRVGSDGAIDPAWPADGLEPFPVDTIQSIQYLPDGQGGLYIVRIESGRPAATHISSDGQILAGPDVSVLDANASYLRHAWLSVDDPINVDLDPDGGLIVAWKDFRNGSLEFRVRWLNPDFSLKSGTPDEGVVVVPSTLDSYKDSLINLHSDGEGGAFILWGVSDPGPLIPYQYLWMAHVEAPVVAGVGDGGPLASGLALSTPYPNPSRGGVAVDLTLPTDRESRADLLDLAGRVIRTQSVSGAGRHSIRFDRLDSLSPGLYFVRASSGTETSSVRFVLER